MAKRQHYPNIFESLSRVTTTVSEWDSPSLEGASADGLSQGDPALVDGSMMIDSPEQMLDRVAVVESEDESESSILRIDVVMRIRANAQEIVIQVIECSNFPALCK